MKYDLGLDERFGAAGETKGLEPAETGAPAERPFIPFETAWLERPLFEVFAEVAERYPSRVALVDAATTLTYAECLQRARDLAVAIAAAAPRGEPVAMAIGNTVAGPVAMLAALAAGRPYLPVDLSAPDQRNGEILAFAGARAIIVEAASAGTAARIAPKLPQIRADAPGRAGEAAPQPTAADEIAAIFYTSGSTGRPKGIAHNGRFLAHSAKMYINNLRITAEDRLTQLFSPAVQRASHTFFGALLTGGTLDIIDLRQQGLQEIDRAAAERGVTIVDTLPGVFRRLFGLGRPSGAFAGLRFMVLAGERIYASDVALFKRHLPRGCRLLCHLGSSESDKYALRYIDHDTPVADGVVPAGHPQPDTQVSLRDGEGREVAPGEPGEIFLTGRYLACGYWKEPELTAAAFATSSEDPQVRTFRIGDMGRFLPDGQLEYLGRRDRMVKVHGNRVELAEIEAALRTHPAVIDGAVVARPLEDDVAIIAYVLCREHDGAQPPESIGSWLAARLPASMVPEEVHQLSELPTLPNLKPDLLALEALDRTLAAARSQARNQAKNQAKNQARTVAGCTAKAASETEADVPGAVLPAPIPAGRTGEGADARDVETRDVETRDVEALARQVWTRLLPAESWDADRTWGAAGGNSLKAMELVLHLETLLGRRVPVQVLLPQTTPRQLVDGLRKVLNRSERAPAASDAPLLFLLPGAGGPFMDMALFAEDLAPAFDVRILDYPSFEPKAPRIITLAETLERVRGDISRAAPSGPLRMLGYSFGGYLATALAQEFRAEGREVEFLGLVDCTPLPRMARLADVLVEDDESHLKEQVSRMGSGPETATERSWSRWVLYSLAVAGIDLVAWLIRRGGLGALSRIVRGIGRFGFERTEAMLWWSLAYLTNRAVLADYLPPRFPGEMWLFRIRDDPGRPLPEDYLWRPYCKDLRIAVIDGAHNTVFAPENVASLRGSVLEALNAPAVPKRLSQVAGF